MKKTRIRLLCWVLTAFCVVGMAVFLMACGGKNESSKPAQNDPTPWPSNSNTEPTHSVQHTNTPYPSNPTAEPKPTLIASYDLILLSKLRNGLAWCSYEDNGEPYYAVINEDFRIIYKTKTTADYKWNVFDDYGDDKCAYYTLGNSHNSYSVIIDEGGNELYRTRNTENTSYAIIGHGDGEFLLCKKVSSFSENGVYFCIIDKNGNIVQQEQEVIFNGAFTFTYCGEGVYINDSYGYVMVYNANNGNSFKIDSSKKGTFLTDFENGKAEYSLYGPIYRITPDVFESYESYCEWVQGRSPDEIERFLPELSYQEPIEVSGVGYGSGGYYPVQLKGADGKAYFTIVDKDGVQQYEPIKFPGFDYIAFTNDDTVQEKLDMRFCDGVFTYSEELEWYAIFPNGTVRKISKEKMYKYFNEFDGTYLYLLMEGGWGTKDSWSVINVFTGEVHEQIYLYDDLGKPHNTGTTETAKPQEKNYITPSSFIIEGKWKNVGTYTFGQVQSGAIIAFDGTHCNVFSPQDTYAFYKSGDEFKLECTSLLSTGTMTFTVRIVDENHIDIYNGSNYLEMLRVD